MDEKFPFFGRARVVSKTTRTGGSGPNDSLLVNHLPAQYGKKTPPIWPLSFPRKATKNIELKLEGEVDTTPRKPTGPR